MSQSLTQNDIQSLQDDILKVIEKIDKKKYQMRNEDYRQLNNHLQYTLTTLRNMSNTIFVEKADPYSGYQSDYTTIGAVGGKKLTYNADGSTKIIDSRAFHTTGEGWENQFDESMLMKPPCFQVPPQNLTSLPTIQKACQYNRMNRL